MVCVVTGAGGFIGGHLVKRLLDDGRHVFATDIKPLGEWWQVHSKAHNVPRMDLRMSQVAYGICRMAERHGTVNRVYNLAADMGGIGYIETQKAACMLSVLVSTNMLWAASSWTGVTYFYSSSACAYHALAQGYEARMTAADNHTIPYALREEDAYYGGGAMPEDGYGWEKLFSERMCRHFFEERQVDIRVARFHNIYGPRGSWKDGREKAPAAICRKVAEAKREGRDWIDVWGDGSALRSFCWIGDCVEGIERLMKSGHHDPINIGSSESISVAGLVRLVGEIAGHPVTIRPDMTKPQGVAGRNSDNTKIRQVLEWEPSTPLRTGLEETYRWIESMVEADAR